MIKNSTAPTMHCDDIVQIFALFLQESMLLKKHLDTPRDMKKILHHMQLFYSLLGLNILWAYWESLHLYLHERIMEKHAKTLELSHETQKLIGLMMELELLHSEMTFLLRNDAQALSFFFLGLFRENLRARPALQKIAEGFELQDETSKQHIRKMKAVTLSTHDYLNKLIPILESLKELLDAYHVSEQALENSGQRSRHTFLAMLRTGEN